MRKIKFRAWDNENKCFFEDTNRAYDGVIKQLLISPAGDINLRKMDGMYHESMFPGRFVLQQYTGLKYRNDLEIYEGDVLRVRRPGRDQQTHYGDNIPLGSYTEPLEPLIEEEIVSVIFENGGFGYIQTADRLRYTVDDSEVIPLSWIFNETTASDEDELKELFSGHWGSRIFEGWEDDKEYLLETYKLGSVQELINYIGVEVIGNIYENPELLP